MAKRLKDKDFVKMKLTPSQERGLEVFHEWWREKGFKRNKKQILRIGGAAGTGKTFFIRYLMSKYKLNPTNCLVVAYTGQAVNVLRSNGVMAKTIHSTFMHVEEELLLDKYGYPVLRGGIPVTIMKFRPIKRISSAIKLIIVDESSFLPEDLEKLVARYKVPILETGDPIQLPPVVGKQCFNLNNLDVLFTEPMRQARDSEILDLATRIRMGEQIDPSKYHDQVLFIRACKDLEDTFFQFKPFIRHSSAIITATNKQRDTIVQMYRQYILKTDSEYPVKGDRMICRKNNYSMMLGEFPLTNGTIGTVMYNVGRSAISRADQTYTMDFKPDVVSNDYYDNLVCDGSYLYGQFGTKMFDKFNPGCKFEYAQAITVHLAQGSQFPYVVFFDSYRPDEEYMMRMRYTAVTRAQEYLVYFLPYYTRF